MKKTLLIVIVVAVVVGVGAFYGGMKYGQSKASASAQGTRGFANLSPAEQQKRLQQMGSGSARLGNGQSGADFVNGEVIAKDDQSITVKLRDGGSKIIFYSDGIDIGKFVSGNPNDLEISQTVIVNGKTNSDGSITAQSIQIRANPINQ